MGARTLISGLNFRVQKGDKIDLVGRKGAGKTTMTKILAGEGQPTAGKVTVSGEVGYLPEDPRSGDPEELAITRILNARGLGDIAVRMTKASLDMASTDASEFDPPVLTAWCGSETFWRTIGVG